VTLFGIQNLRLENQLVGYALEQVRLVIGARLAS
jgi:hypothetical protein